jgi:hypothetical protein
LQSAQRGRRRALLFTVFSKCGYFIGFSGRGAPPFATSVPSSTPLSRTKRRNRHRTNSNVIDSEFLYLTLQVSLFMVPQVATGKVRNAAELLALGPALRRSRRLYTSWMGSLPGPCQCNAAAHLGAAAGVAGPGPLNSHVAPPLPRCERSNSPTRRAFLHIARFFIIRKPLVGSSESTITTQMFQFLDLFCPPAHLNARVLHLFANPCRAYIVGYLAISSTCLNPVCYVHSRSRG